MERYFRIDDIAGAIRRMKRAGVRKLRALAARDWGDDAAYFAGTYGNVLVLARLSKAAPKSQWLRAKRICQR